MVTLDPEDGDYSDADWYERAMITDEEQEYRPLSWFECLVTVILSTIGVGGIMLIASYIKIFLKA